MTQNCQRDTGQKSKGTVQPSPALFGKLQMSSINNAGQVLIAYCLSQYPIPLAFVSGSCPQKQPNWLESCRRNCMGAKLCSSLSHPYTIDMCFNMSSMLSLGLASLTIKANKLIIQSADSSLLQLYAQFLCNIFFIDQCCYKHHTYMHKDTLPMHPSP